MNLGNIETDELLLLAALYPRRRILTHLQKADYASHIGLALNMKPSLTRKHIKKLLDAGLVEIVKDQPKPKNMILTGRGGNRGVVIRLFQTTELGTTILQKLAPAHQPQPPQQAQSKPVFAIDTI